MHAGATVPRRRGAPREGKARRRTRADPRPRVLFVGPAPTRSDRAALARALDVEILAPDARIDAEAVSSRDALVLDGAALGAERILQLVAALEVPRPAVVVLAPRRAASPQWSILAERVDDVVDPGSGDLLPRIVGALKLARIRSELAQKTLEMGEMGSRLESLSRRMADELRLAGSVQRSLHPPPLRHLRLDIAREFIPVREIGGDYYELVPLDADRLVFALGDVMGKGVPAALLAANLKASLRAQLDPGEVALEEVLSRVNHLFWEVSPRGHFSSLFFSVFHFGKDVLEYVNAGHDRPFIVHAGGALEELSVAGSALGLQEESSYTRGEVRIQPGDLLVFFSDGVTERANRDGDLYGVERLRASAARSRGDSARIALYTLLGDVQGWSAGVPAEDDMTLVVVKLR